MTDQIRLCSNGCNRPVAPRYRVCQRCRHGPKLICEQCGGYKQRTSKLCQSCAIKNRRGKNHSSWKGGKTHSGDGYVLVYVPEDPRANSGRYMKEHVLVMEAHLGRQLRKGETVHHKNGQRTDNRIENLELFTSNHPPGQRVVDLVAWAREIISKYGEEFPKVRD